MRKIEEESKLPVTLIVGFLGAGKSTLLKHILESKRKDEDEENKFRCAVIVNDMAVSFDILCKFMQLILYSRH